MNRNAPCCFDRHTNHIYSVGGMQPILGSDLPEDFPRRLELLKEASGLSWRGMARAIGIDYKLLLRWRKGAVPSGGSMYSLLLFACQVRRGLQILLG